MSEGVVVALRGGRTESVHRVHGVVADEDGREALRIGDPRRVTFIRSAAKPFQALPLVADGVAEARGLDARDLALACASHGGEDRHVAGVRRFLEKVEAREEELACGPHPPLHDETAARLARAGEEAGRVHNNCSGKHAGMLALASHHGWSREGYHQEGHPVQERMLQEVAHWTRRHPETIPVATDGCGVRTFALPLEVMATAFARLGVAARRPGAAARVVSAMTSEPFLVGGTARLCTRLVERHGSRVVAKIGAEGVYGAAIIREGWGVALKVEDGGRRAAGPALLEVLGALDILDETELGALESFRMPVVTNTRGEVTGGLEPRLGLRGPG